MAGVYLRVGEPAHHRHLIANIFPQRFEIRRQRVSPARFLWKHIGPVQTKGKAHRHHPPRRMVAMCFALGLHGPNVFPKEAGRGYALTPYLEALGKDIRDQMTVMSGLSHPEVNTGHASDQSFLTAARLPGESTFRNTISLDQLMVEKLV